MAQMSKKNKQKHKQKPDNRTAEALRLLLAEREKEIERLREDISWWRTRYSDLEDRVLLADKMVPITRDISEAIGPPMQSNGNGVHVNGRRFSAQVNSQIEFEVSHLKRLYDHGDVDELEEKMEDWRQSKHSLAPEILRRALLWLGQQEPSEAEPKPYIGRDVVIEEQPFAKESV
jgi:hypothetical protein